MKASLQPQQTRPAAVTPLPARSGLLQRKCACGGTPGFDGECAACRQKRLLGGTFQAKLRINQPGDPFEREADRVAEQVMRMPAPGLPHRSKKGGEEDVFQTRSVVQRRVGGDVGTQAEVPPVVHDVLRSPGRPLDPATRAFFEPRFGHDFSAVRIHTDARAAESARAVNALAYTVGRDVVFGAGQYAPGTGEGQRLLAHELTHVVQQSNNSYSSIADLLIGSPKDVLEQEAEAAAGRILGATVILAHSLAEAAGGITQPVAQEHTSMDPQLRRQPAPAPSSAPAASSPTLGLDPSTISACRVQFRQGTTDAVDPAARDACLETARAYILERGGQVELHGYASEEGAASFNAYLSRQRAEAVKRLLVARGVPAAAIATTGHGEDRTFSGLAPNRRVEVVLFTSLTFPGEVITSLTFPEEVITIPRFICGPDVTREVEAAVASVRSLFARWTIAQKNEACEALRSVPEGYYAWDIVELHNRDWIREEYRPYCATEGATPPCGHTVQVGSECYYAGSANYVIFGTMCRLCYAHFYAHGRAGAMPGYTGYMDFTESSMLDLIDLYKSSSGNVGPSKDWAVAGRDGWPSGGTPPGGDRPGCAPQCSLPYRGRRFRVNWYPHSFHTGGGTR